MHNNINANKGNRKTKSLAQKQDEKQLFKNFLIQCFQTLHPGSEFYDNWHVDLIIEHLYALENEHDFNRLLINMPPRMLKSFIVSVVWPAWLLGQNPSSKIIVASYCQALSNNFSILCKILMQTDWYQEMFPNTKITRGSNTKQKFNTIEHGFRLATSTKGMLIGEGGDVLIVDDPHKAEDCFSNKEMNRCYSWFDQTFSTRLNNPKFGKLLVMMQRLNSNDLTSHILKKKSYHHLIISMLSSHAEEISFRDFSYKRKKNEALHPKLASVKTINQMRHDFGNNIFSALYQQRPIALEGKIFNAKWLQYYHNLPQKECYIYQSWDCANKAGISNDYSVCTTWAVTPDGNYYIIDTMRDKLEYPRLRQKVLDLYKQYNPDAVLIEDHASGQQLLQEFKGDEYDIQVIAINVHKDKTNRFLGILPNFEAGRIYINKDRYWRNDLEHELTNFPHVKHDDQVDSISQFLNWYNKRKLADYCDIKII